ncbi:hypothetical protein RJ639_041513 [Escallonia herrerae]|uniref:Uncharacterized protein n=1 Tax=Escallonia herrerae TaxID=1293975 RepID=A0AA88WJE4_9ASTE|nr:hypothetical protein RJ639_041513 [Escallonia herrerae]
MVCDEEEGVVVLVEVEELDDVGMAGEEVEELVDGVSEEAFVDGLAGKGGDREAAVDDAETAAADLFWCGWLNGSSTDEGPEGIDEIFFGGEDAMDDESDEEDAESSVDLLFRFLQSMFKKVSKRARKASRGVLPDVISPQLSHAEDSYLMDLQANRLKLDNILYPFVVSFAVDGVLLLASLSIVKALLEVICNLGGTVFVVILLLRVVWAAISYFRPGGNDINQKGSFYNRAQPVT